MCALIKISYKKLQGMLIQKDITKVQLHTDVGIFAETMSKLNKGGDVVMDTHTIEQRHKNMQAIKSKDTKIEILLRKELWSRGIHYRKNPKDVFGKPDIVFKGKKIAAFCDSEFWHGYNWEIKRDEIKSHRDFWIPKIERNIKRDNEVNTVLEEDGWIVLRFWGDDIKKNVKACADLIVDALKERDR